MFKLTACVLLLCVVQVRLEAPVYLPPNGNGNGGNGNGKPGSSYLPPNGNGNGNGVAPVYGPPSNGGYGGGPAEEATEPAKYQFEYTVNDPESGNDFGHKEERDGDLTNGEYFVLLPDGRKQIVTYEVDGDSGFKPVITYEEAGNGGYPSGKPGNGGYSY